MLYLMLLTFRQHAKHGPSFLGFLFVGGVLTGNCTANATRWLRLTKPKHRNTAVKYPPDTPGTVRIALRDLQP